MKHLKPVITRHQLHYFHDYYESLANKEDNSLLYASYADILQKAINIIIHFEHTLEKK